MNQRNMGQENMLEHEGHLAITNLFSAMPASAILAKDVGNE
jgi:hypothetical protein